MAVALVLVAVGAGVFVDFHAGELALPVTAVIATIEQHGGEPPEADRHFKQMAAQPGNDAVDQPTRHQGLADDARAGNPRFPCSRRAVAAQRFRRAFAAICVHTGLVGFFALAGGVFLVAGLCRV